MQTHARYRSRIRVLFSECGHRGGSVKQLYRLLTSLDSTQLHMGFISYYRDRMASILYSVPNLFCRYHIPITTVPAPDVMKPLGSLLVPTPFALQYLLMALWALVIHRPNVVYINSLPAQHLPVIWCAKMIGIPVICHLRATRQLTSSDHLGVPHIRRFIAVSARAKAFYEAEGIPADKLDVIHNALPMSEFEQGLRACPRVRLPKGPIYAIQVATLNQNKRPMLAVQAFELAKRNVPHLKLVLVGGGEMKSEIERYLISNGLKEDVLLLGDRRDVPAILAQCHIGLLLSLKEGLPNCVLEYMAAHLPVVVTDLPGIEEVVGQNASGIILKEATSESIAGALTKLATDEDLCKRMGKVGRQIVEQPFLRQECALESICSCIVEVAHR